MKSSLELEVTREAAPATLAEERQLLFRRAALRDIVVSPTFAKSERLCALLTYVCEMSFKGRSAEINEQRIGRAVFGRQRDYDSSIDGIVRTQASRLRQRLEAYYQREGATDAMRVVIPRGSYVPQFVLHEPVVAPVRPAAAEDSGPPPELTGTEASPAPPPAMPASAPAPPVSRSKRSRTVAGLIAACSLLLVLIAVLLVRERSLQARLAQGSAASLANPLWREMFVAGQPTLEVPGDSGLVLFHRFHGQGVTLNEYMAGEYRNPGPHAASESDAAQIETDFAGRRYTSIVDLNAAVALSRLAERAGSSLQVRYARDVRPNDLKTGNIILFGAAEANPWVELIEQGMNFSLHDDYKTRVFTVKNRSPKPSEPAQWTSVTNDPEHRVYGIIGYRPSLSGSGKVLVVEGTSMAGCEAALDFVMDDARMLPVLRRMHHDGGGLPSFELLVTTVNTGASATQSSLVATRWDEP